MTLGPSEQQSELAQRQIHLRRCRAMPVPRSARSMPKSMPKVRGDGSARCWTSDVKASAEVPNQRLQSPAVQHQPRPLRRCGAMLVPLCEARTWSCDVLPAPLRPKSMPKVRGAASAEVQQDRCQRQRRGAESKTAKPCGAVPAKAIVKGAERCAGSAHSQSPCRRCGVMPMPRC
jgi:hypothetical protein